MARKTKSSDNADDPSLWAAGVVTAVTGLPPPKGVLAALLKRQATAKRQKNPAAVALGRLGGQKGGEARARSLSPEKRSEIARKAAKSRWAHSKDAKILKLAETGMTNREVAQNLGISLDSVQRGKKQAQVALCAKMISMLTRSSITSTPSRESTFSSEAGSDSRVPS